MATKKSNRLDIPHTTAERSSPNSPRKSRWPVLKRVLQVTSRAPSENRAFSLDSPEYSADRVPYHRCFAELDQLVLLLQDLDRQDSELTTLLEAQQGQTRTLSMETSCDESETTFNDSVHSTLSPISVESYQETVTSFIALYVQSKFMSFSSGIGEEQDRHDIISSLAARVCPTLPIFQRLYIDPNMIASDNPELENMGICRNIPINQLARFCDIAVLRFLCSITERTSTRAVYWALEYLHQLLSSLIASLNMLNSFGWYGAPPIRIRKGTTMSRHSISYPVLPPMPVVVVGTPPSSPHNNMLTPDRDLTPELDPETGQRSPLSISTSSPSHNPHAIQLRQPPFVRSSTPPDNLRLLPRSNTLPASSDLSSMKSAGHKTHVNVDGEAGSRLRSYTGDTAPPPARQRRTSRQEHHGSDHRAFSPPKQVGGAVFGSMGSIPEEGNSTQDKMFVMESFEQSGNFEESKDGLFGSPSRSSQLAITHRAVNKRDRSATPVQLVSIEEVEDDTDDGSSSLSSDVRLEGNRFPSVSDEEEVRSKPTTIVSNLPELKKPLEFDEQKELGTLVNAEGRISLIAILNAIANLPQTEQLWTDKVGQKCFSLIQLCMNLGLPPGSGEGMSDRMSAKDRRKKLQKQDQVEVKSPTMVKQKPHIVYSNAIIEYSVKALIQCATSMIIGCTNDNAVCRLAHIQLHNPSQSIHDKLLHMFRRIHTHSPTNFRLALTNFAKPTDSSCRKLFHFLHVMLQYCVPGQDVHLNALLMAIVVAVLRLTVDRLVRLDITESSIQNSVVSEACSFFQYAQHLFSQDFIARTKDFKHFHMYIQRIALSVVLPVRPTIKPPEPTESLITTIEEESPEPQQRSTRHYSLTHTKSTDTGLDDKRKEDEEVRTLPSKSSTHKRLIKQATSSISSPTHALKRRRSGSLNLPSESKKRSPFLKQRSVATLKKTSSVEGDSREGGEGVTGDGVREWRGLNLNVLRSRIQRLIVLMNTSEPGTVPESSMLASLIDLNDGDTVVARSMVFLECALFVNKLRSNPNFPTVWVHHNRDSPRMHHVSFNLLKWAEAIGEKLRLVEMKERDMLSRLRKASSDSEGKENLVLPEEPVFPVDRDENQTEDQETLQAVSYAVKMSACTLLLEVTRFLRDPPPHFAPAPSISQLSTPRVSVGQMDRKFSANSSNSESESTKELHPSGGSVFQMPSVSSGHHFGSSLSVEEHDVLERNRHPLSFDDIPPSPRKKRVSVYLRVNSSGPTGGVARKTSTRKHPKFVRVIDSPGELRSGQTSSPNIHRKSVASSQVTASGLHMSFYGGAKGGRRPSVSGGSHPISIPATTQATAQLRRKSMGAYLFAKDSSREAHSYDPLQQASQQHLLSASPNKTAAGGSLGSSLNIGLTKLKRSAQRAFRRARTPTATTRKLPGEAGVSPGSSPAPSHRSKYPRLSSTGSFASPGGVSPTVLPYEDNRKHYPWLDIVEHLIISDACNLEMSIERRRSCKALISALNFVYSNSFDKEDEPVGGADKQSDSESASNGNLTMSRSLSTIFVHQLSQVSRNSASFEPTTSTSNRGQSIPGYNRSSSMEATARRRTQQRVTTNRTISLPANLLQRKETAYSITFANFNYAKFTSTFLGATEEEGSIELFLEEESAFSKPCLMAELDKQRRDYIKTEYLGMMHTPFSILVHAAPILHHTTFTHLKGIAWEMLLDVDSELSQTAGAFFLLACSKESDRTVKGFVSENVHKKGSQVHKEAILRFKVLWDTRYHVWRRMEERAQKKLNMYSEKEDTRDTQQTIGYSLPANPLGQPGTDLPLSPWEPASVCTCKSCDVNPDKCYRSTQLAPLVHTDEVSEQVNHFNVSGVSVPQEASTKPAANVYYGVESDDSEGNIEWEAAEPTLFPRSLLPLIRFVIMSLTPHYSSTATSSQPHTSTSSQPHTSTSSQPHTSTSSQPHTSTASQEAEEEEDYTYSDIVELARNIVWTCMVEDARLFFRPLLNQFNRLYKLITDKNCKSTQVDRLLADTVQPFHVLLNAFHTLPPNAAHVLFNNFIGVVMRHTDQPYIHSNKIVQSVLTLIQMVASSVQGLDAKVLKGILKKESCYTAIMTSARIRGVEKVRVVSDHHQVGQRPYLVTDDMTFGHLIAAACLSDHLSIELLNKWYLVDENKELPVLSSLVIQDHHSAPLDGHYPIFSLQKRMDQHDNVWQRQMDQLFVYKMSEVMRVLLTLQLLLTGPEVEKGFTYSEYAQPNYRFIHNELVELNSFPRKALTSLLYEAGPSVHQQIQLRASDVMLKGMWVRFVLQLFKSVKPDYDWSNSMILFLNVINGSLLLHSEDHTILQYSIATLLVAATKFTAIFKRDGYLMIIPTLIQVYALHMRNKLITRALKFLWTRFFLLDNNVFFLQVTAAAATLLSEETASLSNSVNSNIAAALSAGSVNMEAEEAGKLYAKAVFELTEALDSESLPSDDLEVMQCCQSYLEPELYRKLNSESWQRMPLINVAFLCISLARWNPEALRGMQVLVFIDHLMPLFLDSWDKGGSKQNVSLAMEYLIKGCSNIVKPQNWRGDILSTRKAGAKGAPPQTPGPNAAEDGPVGPSKPFRPEESTAPLTGGAQAGRKTSVAQMVRRLLINPNKKEMTSGRLNLAEGSVRLPHGKHKKASLPLAPLDLQEPLDHNALSKEFKLRRIQDAQQRVLRLSRESLLSISSQYVCHYYHEGGRGGGGSSRKTSGPGGRSLSSSKQERVKPALDSQSVLVLASLTVLMLKQGAANEAALQGKGLNSFMTHCLPNITWTEGYYGSFQNILARLLKLFKHLQKDSNKAIMVYENLTAFITSITKCIRRYPQLVQGQEQHLSKLKSLLETIVNMQSSNTGQLGAVQRRFKNIQVPLLTSAPASFIDAVVHLAAELIVATCRVPQPRLRYHIPDLLSLKATKEHEEILVNKVLLPLCIQLGLRDTIDIPHPSVQDKDYVLKFAESKVEFVLKFSSLKISPEPWFRIIRVICCSFGEVFTLKDWHNIAQWVLLLVHRNLNVPNLKKISTTSVSSNEGESAGGRTARLSSISGSNKQNALESYINFHSCLLEFFESFLVVQRIPLFSMLWPVLRQLEPHLQVALQLVKSNNPAQLDRVMDCIDRCQNLLSSNFNVPPTKSRQELLLDIQYELKYLIPLSGRSTLNRSQTTVDRGTGRPKFFLKKRRASSSFAVTHALTKIGEESSDGDPRSPSSATLPRLFGKAKTISTYRPTSLRFTGRGGAASSSTPSPPRPSAASTAKKKVRLDFDTAVEETKRPSQLGVSDTATVTQKKRRSPSPRRSPKQQLSHSPLVEDSLRSTRKKSPNITRAPKLGVLGKDGSSECYADIEDADDTLSPESVAGVPVKISGNRVTFAAQGVPSIARIAATSPVIHHGLEDLREEDEMTGKKLTVSVEVHDTDEPFPELKSMKENSLKESSEFLQVEREELNESSSSLTPLLVSLSSKRAGTSDVSNNSNSTRKAYISLTPEPRRKPFYSSDGISKPDEDTDGLLESPSNGAASAGTKRRSSKQEQNGGSGRKSSLTELKRKSFSLDRRLSNNSVLSSALKETKKFLYHSLEDDELPQVDY